MGLIWKEDALGAYLEFRNTFTALELKTQAEQGKRNVLAVPTDENAIYFAGKKVGSADDCSALLAEINTLKAEISSLKQRVTNLEN